MANLDGSVRTVLAGTCYAGAILRDDPPRFSRIYRVLFHAARAEGIGPGRLPDSWAWSTAAIWSSSARKSSTSPCSKPNCANRSPGTPRTTRWPERETERIFLAAARVGQHVFARDVLVNCGSQCVFCGLRPASFGARRMLLAGHIKPWKDSTHSERLDPRNGLAACPAHDVAFDTGLITVNGGLRIHLAARSPRRSEPTRLPGSTTDARRCATCCCYRPAPWPLRRYLDWHQQNVFGT